MGLNDLGLLCSVCVNFVALYAAYRKQRARSREDDARVDAEIEATVISRWQAYAAEQEASRAREVGRLEGRIEHLDRELTESRREAVECRERAAKQEERIAGQDRQMAAMAAQLKTLTADLKRAGFRPAPGELIDPLKPPKE